MRMINGGWFGGRMEMREKENGKRKWKVEVEAEDKGQGGKWSR